MTGSTPLVSLGMPIYNEEEYLPKAFDALLAQDFRDLELVVSANASEDATWRICLEYAAREPQIRHSRNPCNIGHVENSLRVCELALKKFFPWLSGHGTTECAAVLPVEYFVGLQVARALRSFRRAARGRQIPSSLALASQR